MLHRLGAGDQDGIGGLAVLELLEMILKLGVQALDAFAGLAARRLADDLEDLLKTLDLAFAFLRVLFQRLAQLVVLGSLGGLLQRADRGALGVKDVLEAIVERIFKGFRGGHEKLLNVLVGTCPRRGVAAAQGCDG